MKQYKFTLNEHDFRQLMNGKELIAEPDGLEPFRAIKIRWAWTKEEVEQHRMIALRKLRKETGQI